MRTNILDAKTLKDMLIGGTEYIRTNSAKINDLNVFPVPDGDTGTNMTKTLEGGVSLVIKENPDSISYIIDKFAKGVLRGARGNSGVILSQIFSGIKDGLSGWDTVSALDLSKAYKNGIEKAYAAVVNPTEGTILTVFRESTEYAAKNITENSAIEDFYKLHIEEAKRSLSRTKEILPVLAEADVVDSGGAGYLCIATGMYLTLIGEYSADLYEFREEEEKTPLLDFDRFTRNSSMKYGYCTEFLLRITENKCNPDSFETDTIVKELMNIGGESIVAYKDGDILKIHVHTMIPGRVMDIAQKYGEFLTVKIENMELEHTEAQKEPQKARKKFATVAVAAGEGICALFRHMGADDIVSGGQTDNPSVEEFISSFDRVNADSIIVLPNNKNVFLAAKKASELYEKSKVYIIPSHSLMEGYGALSVITAGIEDVGALTESAKRAAKGVCGGEITMAVKDAVIGGKEIKKGEYISIINGEIASVSDTRDGALFDMLDAADICEYEIITLFIGANVNDSERVAITEGLQEKYPEHEIVVHIGNQEVYDYLVALE